MATFIRSILEDIEFGKGLILWYNDTYSMPFATFMSLSPSLQYHTIHRHMVDVYNLGLHYDAYTVLIYYYNPELNVNEIIDNHKTTGVVTHFIKKDIITEPLSIDKACERGILYAIEYVTKPF